MIMRDRATGRSRGFGFVTYKDMATVDKVLQQSLSLDGRKLDIKAAASREDMAQEKMFGSSSQNTSKKIFVAGLPQDLMEEEFQQYFSNFGTIIEAVIKTDKTTGVSRGFGFITFTTSAAVDKVMAQTSHTISGNAVDVKIAVPKYAMNGFPGPQGPGVPQQAYSAYNAYNAPAQYPRYDPQPSYGGFQQTAAPPQYQQQYGQQTYGQQAPFGQQAPAPYPQQIDNGGYNRATFNRGVRSFHPYGRK
jgi:RNA-binding protein Musashi